MYHKIQSFQIEMTREKAHFQEDEPFLEKLLGDLRYRKIIGYIPSNSKVLDLGCGYRGKFLKKISGKISRGVGLDISVSPNFLTAKIDLIAHDLNRPLPFQNNKFDVVVSLANLEHLEEPEKSLMEIHRVLKPGGILLLTAPSTYGKPVLELLSFLRLVSRQEIEDHKNYFNKKILLDYCENIGFSSCKHKYFQAGMNNFLIAKK